MTDRAGPRALYLAINDEEYDAEARGYLAGLLPPDWVLADGPEQATAILALDVDVDSDPAERAGPALRVVATVGSEADVSVTRDGAVRVLSVPAESPFSRLAVAEYTVAVMLMLARNLLAVVRKTNAADWAPGRDVPILTDQQTYTYNWTAQEGSGFLLGKVVGIVGAGAIGAKLAQLLAPFGVQLIYTQRHRLPAADEQRLGLGWREFDDLVRESDFIALCHRLQEGPGGNEHQFGAREFSLMKPSAFLINTARGRIVDEEALVAALRNSDIAGAGLDVFRHEPLPKDHPLLSLAGDNVVLTPHIASGTENEYLRFVLRAVLDACPG